MKETTKCAGFNRECDEQISPRATSGLCKKCYANKNYAEKHPAAKSRVKTAALTKAAAKTNGHARAAHGNGNGDGKISIKLSETALNQLLVALPAPAKAGMFAWWAEGIGS